LAVKAAVILVVAIAIGFAICWAAGIVEFTYPNIVPNEPLLCPQKVSRLDGTNMILESGDVIALLPRHPSERSAGEIYSDISNQVVRSGFEVDVEPKGKDRVEVFVRHPRKFRDTVPPFTVPLFRQTVGKMYREAVALGMYVIPNSQQDGAAKGSQPIPSETNSMSSAAGSRR
jgi:hypothetical protein